MDESTPKRGKRGRPTNASKWLTLDEVSDILRCDVDVLSRMLAKLPNTLPGATFDDDGWKVPERALRVVLNAPCGPLPQMATVQDVAESLRKDEKTIYAWLKLMKPGAKPVPLLPHRKVLGSIRIDPRDVLALPSAMPGPRPSFFADKEAAREI